MKYVLLLLLTFPVFSQSILTMYCNDNQIIIHLKKEKRTLRPFFIYDLTKGIKTSEIQTNFFHDTYEGDEIWVSYGETILAIQGSSFSTESAHAYYSTEDIIDYTEAINNDLIFSCSIE